MHLSNWVNGGVENGNKSTCVVEACRSDYLVKVDKFPVSIFLIHTLINKKASFWHVFCQMYAFKKIRTSTCVRDFEPICDVTMTSQFCWNFVDMFCQFLTSLRPHIFAASFDQSVALQRHSYLKK